MLATDDYALESLDHARRDRIDKIIATLRKLTR
jgi:hypothetical protein